MRRLLILLVLAACGSSSPGPAWPTRAEPEEDGGESLEPRSAAVAVEASAEGEDAELAALIEEAITVTPAVTPAEAATPAPTAEPEDVIMTEEITIEIEE